MRPVRRADNLTTFMSRISGNVEPSRPAQACNGIILPFLPFHLFRGQAFREKKLYYLRFEEGTGIFCINIGNKLPVTLNINQ